MQGCDGHLSAKMSASFARPYIFMPSVLLTPLSYSPDSRAWFDLLGGYREPIWLDSGRPGSAYGRYDIMSALPDLTVTTRGLQTRVVDSHNRVLEVSEANPLQLLESYQLAGVDTAAGMPFSGGFMGYFGYDLGRRFESLPEQAEDDIAAPEMHLGRYPWAIVQDHEQQQAWLVEHPEGQLSAELREKIRFHDLRKHINNDEKLFKISSFEKNIKEDYYYKSLARIHQYILAGDCYQVNFAQRFTARYEGEPLAAYYRLRETMASPFSAFYQTPALTLLSLSPERFMAVHQGVAETHPIKGTIARGATPEADRANAAWLQQSSKNRAENLMIVDLLRNDLSKHCDNVRVPALFSLQSFANVHHLVSSVRGELRPGVHPLQVLQDSFPGGSITGAPKIRAMEIIEELEPVRRSVYCGSIGYISADGNMDTSIAIRTLVCANGKVHCWGGGGIVSDSDPQEEYQESLTKVRLLMTTLEENFGTAKPR